MTAPVDPQLPLRQFVKSHEFFIGIDSDGCAFDTMEVKHKECFIPNIIRFYRLATISKYVREVAEFLNLYSKWRGINRFPGLVLLMDMLAGRVDVVRRHPRLPALPGLRAWIGEETRLSNPALAAAVKHRETRTSSWRSPGVRRSIVPSMKSSSTFLPSRWFANHWKACAARPTCGGLGDAARRPGTGMDRTRHGQARVATGGSRAGQQARTDCPGDGRSLRSRKRS